MEAPTWERIVSGDGEAMREAYAVYRDHVYRTCYYILGERPDLIEDAVHEAFIAAFQNMHQLRRPEAFKPWLTKIAVRKSHLLMRERSNIRLLPIDEIERLSPAVAETPERTFLDQEQSRAVNNAVLQLPIEDRTIVTLFYFNRWSVQQISEELDMPEGTIKWRLYKARKTLLRKLDRHAILGRSGQGNRAQGDGSE